MTILPETRKRRFNESPHECAVETKAPLLETEPEEQPIQEEPIEADNESNVESIQQSFLLQTDVTNVVNGDVQRVTTVESDVISGIQGSPFTNIEIKRESTENQTPKTEQPSEQIFKTRKIRAVKLSSMDKDQEKPQLLEKPSDIITIERVFLTKIMRQRDGSERVIETSESVSPFEALPEDDEVDKVEDVKDSRGRVTKKVTTSTVFMSTKRTLVKKSQLMPDGSEEPVEKDIVEKEETKEMKAPVIKRVVKRVLQQPDGSEKVVEEPQSVKPFEVKETKEESKPEVTEKREGRKKIRLVKKKVVDTFQRRVVKKVTKRPDGKQEGPVEEEVIKPVEPVSYRIVRRTVKHPDGKTTVTEEPDFEMPDDTKPSVEEIKDRRGNVVRRVTTKPVPMTTVRKVYRTIIISPDGREESVQERVEERQQPGKPDEEEPGKAPREDGLAPFTVSVKQTDEEPEDVTVEDGRVTRKTVTVRKRIIKRIIVLPDGTRKEVEEEIDEPEERGREDDQYFVIDRKDESVTREIEEPKEPERVPEHPRKEERDEEIVKPMDVEEVQALPSEPEGYEPEEKPEEGVVTKVNQDGRIIRKTITTRKRIIRRIVVMSDGTRKEVEEEVDEPTDQETDEQYLVISGRDERDIQEPREPSRRSVQPSKQEPEEEIVRPMDVEQVESVPSEPEETPQDDESIRTRVTSDGRVLQKTVTVRKRIVKRIIRMPDGTQKEIEEEVPLRPDEEKEPTGEVRVVDESKSEIFMPVTLDVDSKKEVAKEPRHVERVFVTRIMRQRDGSERVIETSESVSPFEALPEDDEVDKVEDVKDSRGRVTKKVTTSTVFMSTKRTLVKKSQLMPDGSEEPVEKDIVEKEETKEMKAPVIKRIVKRVLQQPDGSEKVVEEPQSVKPFEVKETKEESKPEVTEKREGRKKIRLVKKKVVDTFQRRVVKKVTKRPDGKQEGPVEEEVIKPVEPVSYRIVRRTVKHPDGKTTVTEEPDFEMPDDTKPSVEEIKDRRGNVVRRVTTKPVPMITVRKVYRTIIISPDGREESVQERVEERQQPGKPDEEEPGKAPREDGLAPFTVSVKQTDEEPEDVTVEDGRVTRKTVTVRKRIIKRIIVLPDGTRKEVEEEIDEPEERGREDDQYFVIDRKDESVTREIEEPKEPERAPEHPRKEERDEEIVKPMDVEEVQALPSEPEGYEPEEKPEEGVVTKVSQDGRIIRKTITTRKRIIRRIVVMSDGTRKEVEEEVDEPTDQETDEQYLVISGRDERDIQEPREPSRRSVQPSKQEPEEEIVRPMDVEQVESVPSEPEETPQDDESIRTRVTSDGRVLQKTVTVRKRIVKRIIRMPDGTQKEIEEEVPLRPDEEKEPTGEVRVVDESKSEIFMPVTLDVDSKKEVAKEPRHVERVFVTRIMRQRDGSERVIETSESVSPFEALPEDDEVDKVEDVKDSRGRVTKKVTTSTVFMSTKRTLVKKSQLMPDGSEEPVEKDIVEKEETKEMKAPVIKRIVKRVLQQPDGSEKVVEEPQSVKPFEVKETKEESKPEVTEKREGRKKIRLVKKKVVDTFQRRVVKKVTKRPDGKQEGPVEEEVIKPVEPVSYRIVRRTVKHPDGKTTVTEEPDFEMPDDTKPSVEEIKDRRGNVVRRVTTKPVPMITVRKVYRTIIISPDGREESVQERVEERQQPGKPDEEEPGKAPREDGLAPFTVSVKQTDEEPEDVTVEDGRVIRKTVTVRKRIIKRIIVLPDGTRKEVEEEIDEPEERGREDDQYFVIDRKDESVTREIEEPKEPERAPEHPRKEERDEEIVKPMDVEEVQALPSEPEGYEPEEKPEEGVVTKVSQDGRIIRKTITTRKRIIRRIVVMSDGTRKEVEEEVDEPTDQETDEQYLVISGRDERDIQEPREPSRRSVQPSKQEPEEEIVRPMDVEQVESVPSEPEETPQDDESIRTRVTSDGRVLQKTVTVRKRIVKRIIRMPDGTQKEIEEEVPLRPDEEKEPTGEVRVVDESKSEIFMPVTLDVDSKKEVAKEPRHVERVFVTRIMRQRDGSERVIETSESVSPFEALPEDDEVDKVEDVKDSRGRVTKKVTTSTVFMSTKRTLVKKSQLMPDGSEEPVEKDIVEKEETKEMKAPVIKRIVKRVLQQPDGSEKVVEEPQSVKPFEVKETKEESKPEVTEKREGRKKIRLVKKKVVDTFQRRVVKKVTKRPDGKQEGPVEEEVIKPVEPVSYRIVRRTVKHPDGKTTVTEEPDFEMPDDTKPSVEEIKDRRGNVVRRVTTKPVPMITVRKVYRTIIISPDGREESVQERVEERQQPGKPDEEEPGKAPREDGLAPFTVSVKQTDEEPEDVTVEDGRVTRKTVTVRKRIIKRIIVLPDGTRKEVEEEIDEPEERDREDDQYFVIDRKDESVTREIEEPKEPERVPEHPRKEERDEEIVKPMDVEEVQALPSEPEGYEPEEKPEEGVVTKVSQDGRIIRKTITTRKRIIRRIVVMSDGTRKEVEEEVDEPTDQETDEQYLVISGRDERDIQEPREPSRRSVQPSKQEPEEEIVRPMDVEQVESVPSEPEETPQDDESIRTRVTSDGRVLQKTVTVRKRIVKRIIRMPDGTQKEIEEEVPLRPDEEKEPTGEVRVVDESKSEIFMPVTLDVDSKKEVAKEPRHVERVFVTRIMRQRDGSERVIETSESVSPFEALPEDDEVDKVEDVKDSRGRVTKKVTTSTVFMSTKRTLVKKSQLMPDGSEEPVEKDIVEKEETKEMKAPVIKRIVKRVLQQPDGSEKVVEEPQSVKPFEVKETKEESKPEVTEKREGRKKIRLVKKKVVDTFQRRVVKKVTKRPDGKQEGPVEEEVIKPVEPVSYRIVRRTVKHPDGKTTVTEEPDFEMPDDTKPSVEEIKDRRGNVVRRVTTKPVPMITVRKVYRTIIISPDGREESVQERVEERQQPGKPDEEEPGKAPREDGLAPFTVSVKQTDEEPEDVTVEDGRVTRKTVTVRKRIIKRIIVLPDGTRKEVEEEIDEPEERDREDDQYFVIDRKDESVTREIEEPKEPERVPEHPRKEERDEEIVKPMDVEEVQALPSEPEGYEPEEKPEEGVVTKVSQDGRIIRKTITTRKRIIRRIVVMSDGTRKEVEEEVDEPTDQETDEQYLVISGRDERDIQEPREPSRRSVQPSKQEPEEEIVRPMDVEQVESVPSEPEETPQDDESIRTRVTSDGRVLQKTVTVRKRIVKRIIRMPDGTQKEIEEEVLIRPEEEKEPTGEVRVVDESKSEIFMPVTLDVDSKKEVAKEPRHVERVFVTRIMRQRDGSERVIETSESVSPLEALPEDDEVDKVEDVKDSRGRVTKKVTTSTVFMSTKRTLVKKSQLMPDGSEEPVEKDIVEKEETKEMKVPVIKRVVKRVLQQPDGSEKVVEEPQSVKPFEVKEIKEESKPEVTEKREGRKKISLVKKKVVDTFQRRVVKKVTKRPDGKQEGPVVEEIRKPVEILSKEFDSRRSVENLLDRKVEQVKDPKGIIIRKIVTLPFAVVTTRKVFRTILLAPDGSEESVQERVEDYRKDQKEVSGTQLKLDGSREVMSQELSSVLSTVSNVFENVKPKLIEKVSVTRILRHDDGTEQTIGKSETLSPLHPDADDERPEYSEEVKDVKGTVSHIITVTPVYILCKQGVTKKTIVNSDGREKLLEEHVTGKEESVENKAPVIKRINKRLITDSKGEERVFEDVEYVEPFEIREEIEDEAPSVAEELKEGIKTKILVRKLKTTVKTKAFMKKYRKKSGSVHSPDEEIHMRYVEPVSFTIVERQVTDESGRNIVVKEPKYAYHGDAVEVVESVKDKRGNILKKVITRPVPAITARKISRVIVFAEDGTEQSIQEKVDESDEIKELQRFLPDIGESPDTVTYGYEKGKGTSRVQRGSGEGPGETTFSLKMIQGTTRTQGSFSEQQSDYQGVYVDITEQGTELSSQTRTTVKQVIHHADEPTHDTENVDKLLPLEGTAPSTKEEPNQVQRVFQTKMIRQIDGSERVIETSEIVAPVSVHEEPSPEKEENLVYLKKETVFERSFKIDSDGEEVLHASKLIQPEEVKVIEIPVPKISEIGGVEPDVKQWAVLKPFSILVAAEEGEPEISAIREKGKTAKIIKRKIRESKHDLVSKKKPDGEEPGTMSEEIATPMEPTSWNYAKKTVVTPDGRESVVEVPDYKFDEDVKPSFEEVKDNRGKVVKKIMRMPLPAITSKKIFETVVVSPKGRELSRTSHTEDTGKLQQPGDVIQVELKRGIKEVRTKEVIEEKLLKPVSHTLLECQELDEQTEAIPDTDERYVIRGGKKFIVLHSGAEEKETSTPSEFVYQRPKKVERVFTTVIERSKNGQESVLQQSEAVAPIDGDCDQVERTDDVTDKTGAVVNKVTIIPVSVTQESVYIKKKTLLPDGKEIPKGKVLIKKEEPKQASPLKVKKTPSERKGKGKDIEHYKPYQLKEIQMMPKPEIALKKEHGDNVRTFKQKVKETVQNQAVKRVWKTPEGKTCGFEEEIVIEPAEVAGYEFVVRQTKGPDGKDTTVTEPVYQLPSDVFSEPTEAKDRKGHISKRSVRSVLPVITARKIYRVVILNPQGEQISVNERITEQKLPEEVEEFDVKESLFPSPQLAISKVNKPTASPERKTPSPVAGKRSPTSPNRKSPIADGKAKPEGKRTPSPERKSPDSKGRVSPQSQKRKVSAEPRQKAAAEEELIPISFNLNLESAPEEEIIDSMPGKDLVMGAAPTVRMTKDEKEDLIKQMFPVDTPSDEDEPAKPKQRPMPKRFEQAVKRVTYMNYWQKLKDYAEKRPKVQSVEETVVRFGRTESQVKSAWQEIVDKVEIRDEEVDFDSFMIWLTFVERELASLKPISNRFDSLQEQKEYHEVCVYFSLFNSKKALLLICN